MGHVTHLTVRENVCACRCWE